MAAERVAAMVSSVLTEAVFDVTEPQALKWLTQAHRLLVIRSECFRKMLSLGNTVEGQANYAIPAEVLEIREVLVNGVPYGNGRHSDVAASVLSYIWFQNLIAGGGVSAPEYTEAGLEELSLVPVPKESGLPIVVYAICRAPALLTADDTTLKTPVEFDDAIIAGAIATGLTRVENRPDLAAPHNATFEAAATALLRQQRRRQRGPGPRQLRVVGCNA